MSESLNNGGESSSAEQWKDLAEQMASHSTVDGSGNTVYLGREVDESERAKVEESGFEKPGESPRGTTWDRNSAITEDVYPQLEGESDYDYELRLNNMMAEARRDIEGDAVTDAKKAENRAHADFMQGKISYDDVDKVRGELRRAEEDRDYYRGVPEEEALGIARQFGNVESRDSKHLESVRGSGFDHNSAITKDVYPQLEGESDYDYELRLNNMMAEARRDIEGDAVTDAKKAENRAHADFMQGKISYDDVDKARKKLELTESLHKKGKI